MTEQNDGQSIVPVNDNTKPFHPPKNSANENSMEYFQKSDGGMVWSEQAKSD